MSEHPNAEATPSYGGDGEPGATEGPNSGGVMFKKKNRVNIRKRGAAEGSEKVHSLSVSFTSGLGRVEVCQCTFSIVLFITRRVSSGKVQDKFVHGPERIS